MDDDETDRRRQARTPAEDEDHRGFDTDRTADLSGDATGELGVLFFCPNKDYAVVREVVADEVPTCPHDGAVLVRHQARP